MAKTPASSDANGNFSDVLEDLEQGPLNESLDPAGFGEDNSEINISTDDLPPDSPGDGEVSAVENGEVSLLEGEEGSRIENGELSRCEDESLLNISSDFLPAESPERKSDFNKLRFSVFLLIAKLIPFFRRFLTFP